MRLPIPIFVLVAIAGVTRAQTTVARDPVESAVIAGRVFDAERKPVAGAHIIVTILAHPELPPAVAWCLEDDASRKLEAVTDARGVFRVALPVASAAEVFAEGAGGTFSPRVFPAIASDFLQLRLAAPHHFTGVVTDELGAPVAGAVVTEDMHLGEQYAREQYGRARHLLSTSSDDHGRFELPALDGGHAIWGGGARTVLAAKDGRASDLRLYRIDGQDLLDLDLSLKAPEATAAIRTAKQGRPPAGDVNFLVEAHDSHGPCARHRVVMAVSDQNNVPHMWTTNTDDEGRLAIRELRPGHRLESWIECDGVFLPFVAATAGAVTQDLGVVHVTHGKTLTGTMIDPDGLPLAHARIVLSADDSPFRRITYCDRGGRYRFEELPAGTARLVVSAGFAGVAVAEVGQDSTKFDLRIEKGDTASGTVLLPDGSPARHARLQYIVSPTAEGNSGVRESIYLFGNSDDEGHFTVRGLPTGSACTMWGMCVQDDTGYMGSTTSSGDANDSIKLTLQVHHGRL